jgi:hypothetical protein
VIGESDDGFEPGDAVPTKLPLERGELIDPAAVEPMPVVAGGDAADLAGQFTLENWRTSVVDRGRKDPAKAVVGPDKVEEQRSPRFGNAVEEAGAGRARLVLVAGEAGIGKTTLVSEAAARSGWAVGWGTCADAERAPAFWAWSTALRGLLQAVGPTVTEGLSDVGELARLLPELCGPAGGEPSVVDTEAARLRLFDAIARLLERIAGHAPAFVVLDDLQWADASTLALLRFVVRPYRPVPLVIVGVYRPDELTEPLLTRADGIVAAAHVSLRE